MLVTLLRRGRPQHNRYRALATTRPCDDDRGTAGIDVTRLHAIHRLRAVRIENLLLVLHHHVVVVAELLDDTLARPQPRLYDRLIDAPRDIDAETARRLDEVAGLHGREGHHFGKTQQGQRQLQLIKRGRHVEVLPGIALGRIGRQSVRIVIMRLAHAKLQGPLVHPTDKRIEGPGRMDRQYNGCVIRALHHQRVAEVSNGHLLADLNADPARFTAIDVRRRRGHRVKRVASRSDVLKDKQERHQLR